MTLNTEGLPTTLAEVSGLFERRATWQSWLDVEASLALVQAELGLIPAAAAREIAAKANFTAIDPGALAADIEETRAPVVSLTRALAAACAGDAGGYVHWGATTQNVMQTGLVLQMKKADAAFMARFDALLVALADLAEKTATTVTVARTNQRHALPVTFGFKVAAWIEELLRHRERFAEVRKRAFRAQWGGTVGAMHVMGRDGPALNLVLAARLGLGAYEVPSRAALDGLGEYGISLGLFAASAGKIARNLYQLMGDETEEVQEALGEAVVGSSTMPHKINPKYSVRVIALAAEIRGRAPVILEAMQPSHEGDAAANFVLTDAIETLSPQAFALADQMADLIGRIVINPEAMRRNLALKGELIASENVMMALAPKLGRNKAHDLVHDAATQSLRTGAPLISVLMEDEAVAGLADQEAIRKAAEPEHYLGLSVALAEKMAARAREAVAG
ncbi:lyase family protein [Martelella sp. HB161492]|uniref:lyase family protein n=1 Tax=Martelella sp. HB161492 TaxID=2720726 RepID=UPI0015910E53|nr:lyase family protein [Martelella sp. HB161492]